MAALFQEAHIQQHICKTALHYMSRHNTPIVKTNLFQFIRNYFRNTHWFTFHRLPICLNLAGLQTQAHITFITQNLCSFDKVAHSKAMPIPYDMLTHTGIDILHACTTPQAAQQWQRHEPSPTSGIFQSCTMRSKANLFTEICKSQCVSHFAAS